MGEVVPPPAPRVRVVDPDLNLTRITFFMVGLIVGACITLLLFTRPQAGEQKLIFNDCGRNVDMTSRCGHGSPDVSPDD